MYQEYIGSLPELSQGFPGLVGKSKTSFSLITYLHSHEYSIKIAWIRSLVCLRCHWWRSSNLPLGLKHGGRASPKRWALYTSWEPAVIAGVLQSTVRSSTDEAKESPVVQARGLENCVANDEGAYFIAKLHRQYVLQMMMDTTGRQEESCGWKVIL